MGTLTLAWEALEADRPKLWLAAGAALGGAMLSKYTGVLLAPSALGYLLFSQRDRRWLKTPRPYLAGVTALIVFLPVVYWNWKHEWASFLFQSKGRFEESRGFSLFSYLGAQSLAMYPLALPLLGAAVLRVLKPTRPAEDFFRACFLPMFLLFAFVSCLRPAHVLWPLASYLGLVVVMAGIAADGEGKIARFYRRARAGLVAVSGAVMVAAAVPAMSVGLSGVLEASVWDAVAKSSDLVSGLEAAADATAVIAVAVRLNFGAVSPLPSVGADFGAEASLSDAGAGGSGRSSAVEASWGWATCEEAATGALAGRSLPSSELSVVPEAATC
jgi:4-amino-4-deoxy-L-arabinose transferase-like glycosyltransferase